MTPEVAGLKGTTLGGSNTHHCTEKAHDGPARDSSCALHILEDRACGINGVLGPATYGHTQEILHSQGSSTEVPELRLWCFKGFRTAEHWKPDDVSIKQVYLQSSPHKEHERCQGNKDLALPLHKTLWFPRHRCTSLQP